MPNPNPEAHTIGQKALGVGWRAGFTAGIPFTAYEAIKFIDSPSLGKGALVLGGLSVVGTSAKVGLSMEKEPLVNDEPVELSSIIRLAIEDVEFR